MNYNNKIENRIRKLSYNKGVFIDYIQFLNNEGKSSGTVNEYKSCVFRFLEKVNKELPQISEHDIQKYFTENFKTEANLNKNYRAVKNFLSFAKLNLLMDNDFLKNIKTNIQSLKGKELSKCLSIEDIMKIRKVLHEEKEFQLLFVFEMAYVYGLRLEEIAMCTMTNYDFESTSFDIGSKRVIIDQYLSDIIKYNNHVFYEVQPETIQINYYPKIGELTGIHFSWNDIKTTRNQYFIRCPKCNELHPNESEFWNLLNFDDDKRGTCWFVCKYCVQDGKDI